MNKVAVLGEHINMGMYCTRPTADLYRQTGLNTGNLAFIYAVLSHLQNEVTLLPWHASPEQYEAVDIIVIPCANQLGKHTDLGRHAELLRKSGKPVVAIGLGAQAEVLGSDIELTEGTATWVETIRASCINPGAPNIYTRGPYTSQQLDRLGFPGSLPGGCPSHFINPAPNLGHRIHAAWTSMPVPRSLSVAGGHHRWAKARIIEQQLIAMMQDPRSFGQYVVQSEEDMVRLARNDFDLIEPATLELLRQYLCPHYAMDEFKTWSRMYARAFFDINAWMDSLREADLTIGPRYHGTALAIQAEKMGVTIAVDSRTTELCMETGVPFLTAEELATKPLTRHSIKQMIKFDPAAYDKHRLKKAKLYVDFLKSNKLVPSSYLEKLATST
ncbi:MAG: polysaccharide pyruvyl transferase family protein [Brevundimonas sp.]|nr:polysaccharide pyruvyl transferase family protein [Brevundimonas sp.]